MKMSESAEKQKRRLHFQKHWLNNRTFKDWLTPGENSKVAYCMICDLEFPAHISNVQRHSRNQNHLQKWKNDFVDGEMLLNNAEEMNLSRHDSEVMQVIDLRSDSVSIPPRIMRIAMLKAKIGDSAYGTDEAVIELEQTLAELLEQESGLFFPTHVMANLVAVLTHCQARGSIAIAGRESDIAISNAEALQKFGGLNLKLLDEFQSGVYCLDALDKILKTVKPVSPETKLVSYECPHTRKGGKVPPLDWISKLISICATSDALVHCDGTRLINAAICERLNPSVLVKGCDSVTFAIDKTYGAPLGAVLVGSYEFINKAEKLRRFLGGQIHQAGLFASAGSFAISQNTHAVEQCHKLALEIAQCVASLKNDFISVDTCVHTNVIHVTCLLPELFDAYAFKERLETINASENSGENHGTILLCEALNAHTAAIFIHTDVTKENAWSIVEKLKHVVEELT